jgi:hypothetical protein
MLRGRIFSVIALNPRPLVVRVAAGLVAVAVSYVTVRPGDDTQKDEDRHCNDAYDHGWETETGAAGGVFACEDEGVQHDTPYCFKSTLAKA